MIARNGLHSFDLISFLTALGNHWLSTPPSFQIGVAWIEHEAAARFIIKYQQERLSDPDHTVALTDSP